MYVLANYYISNSGNHGDLVSYEREREARPMRMKGKRKGRLDWGIGGIDGEVVMMGFVFSVIVVFHELPDE